MILDTQETFSEGQSIAAAAGDVVSTNVLDTGPASSGQGESVYLYVKTVAAVTSGGAATVQVVLQDSADNATFADVQVYSPPLAIAALGANKTIAIGRIPVVMRRYIRVVYRIGTATTTAGSASAYLVKDVDAQQFMPTSFTVA
jgi:hypothetical protein